MIKISNLHFRYNKRQAPVISGIDLEILPGNIYGLLGENGVGKTTLLRLMCGLLFPSSGTCTVFGMESRKRLPDMLEKIYYLPEVLSIPTMNIIDYGKTYGKLYPNFNTEQFLYYLEKFNIDLKKKMKNLSHGQQKKSLIAFSLACNTPLLFLDEPTNGLDIPSKSIFRQLLAESINDSRSIVISTHQVLDLENLIDPIIILEFNQILLNNTVAEISEKLKFTLQEQAPPSALYSEQTLGGFLSVEPNNDNSNTKINIELLFNAAISNKDFFKQTFIKE